MNIRYKLGLLEKRLARTMSTSQMRSAPPTLMPAGIGPWSGTDGFDTSYELDDVLPTVDAVMMLRVQRERMSGGYFPTAREYAVTYGLHYAGPIGHGNALICNPIGEGRYLIVMVVERTGMKPHPNLPGPRIAGIRISAERLVRAQET